MFAALVGGISGCKDREPDPPPPTVVEDAEPEPAEWEDFREGKTIRTITREDLVPVPEVTIEPEPLAEGWTTKNAGKGEVLVAAPYLELAADNPATERRGFVNVWDTKKPKDRAKEVLLVDFEDGVVGRYDSLNFQYDQLGVAVGKAVVDGELAKVFIHARDGLVVPIRTEAFEDFERVTHSLTGHTWLLEVTHEPAEGLPTPRMSGRYVFWPDLRKPPQTEIRELPFTPEKFRGPQSIYVADAPIVVDSSTWDADPCATVELEADGGWHCLARGTIALTGGWRLVYRASDVPPLFYKEGSSELQELKFDHCTVDESRPMAEPRVLLTCDKDLLQVIWTPERSYSLDDWWDWSGDPFSNTARDGSLHAISQPENEGLSYSKYQWLNLLGPKALTTPKVHDLTPGLSANSFGLVGDADPPRRLFALDVEDAALRSLPKPGSCRYVHAYSTSVEAYLIGCSRTELGPSARTYLLDRSQSVAVGVPRFVGRYFRGWYSVGQRRIVGTVPEARRVTLRMWETPTVR